jgi:hypothetical protein
MLHGGTPANESRVMQRDAYDGVPGGEAPENISH